MRRQAIAVDITGPVATITVNRPEKRNALDSTVRREIIEELDALRALEAVRVLVLAGAGDRAFVAGADVAEFAERTPDEQRAVMEGPSLFEEVAGFPRPTIARIQGFALGGGCELALACDIRVASRSARMGQPEIRLGLLPGGGGTQRLPRLVGYGQALRLILTGEIVGAEEAARIGLVDMVVEDADLDEAVGRLTSAIAASSPVAVAAAREAIRSTFQLPLDAGLRLERELFLRAFASEDGMEGVRAFLEKRAPDFRGR